MYVYEKGSVHSEPVKAITLSSIDVGSTVYMNLKGVPKEFVVVNHGIPGNSSMYDSSCNGTWLFLKDTYGSAAWNKSTVADYDSSAIHSYLNGDFLKLFDVAAQNAIKSVKLPYMNRNGTYNFSIMQGSNGLSTKVFLLAAYEIGWTTSNYTYMPQDGYRLEYFQAGTSAEASAKRAASERWWLRTPNTYADTTVFTNNQEGDWFNPATPTELYGIRPAIILPSTAIFDENTLQFVEA